jgi:hypothetical protein
MSLHGHAWTVLPHLTRRVAPSLKPAAARFTCTAKDPKWGSVELSGWLSDAWESRELAVLIHGLGGSSESSYLSSAVRTSVEAGVACLRLNLRGADLSGADVYHSGLSSDIACAIQSAALARYDRVYVIGYSVGGHVALHYALSGVDPRVRGVAAICAPLDLAHSAKALDSSLVSAYRHYVLTSLKRCYRATAARRSLAAPLEQVVRVRTIREWDDLVVVPRFGFANADEYYGLTSVGPRLAELVVPALYVGTERDPMVPEYTVRPALAAASPSLETHWSARGGHLGFPRQLSLDEAAPAGLDAQVLSWLRRRP